MAEGHRWQQEQQARSRLELAWLVAALSRQKRLPPLERLLRPPRTGNRDPSVEERRREYEDLVKRLG